MITSYKKVEGKAKNMHLFTDIPWKCVQFVPNLLLNTVQIKLQPLLM